MAIVLKDLDAVDTVAVLNVDEAHCGGIFSLQYPTGGTGTIKVQATMDEVTWETLIMIKSDDTTPTEVDNAAAAGLYTGTVPVCKKIKAVKTANAGACICGFGISAPY